MNAMPPRNSCYSQSQFSEERKGIKPTLDQLPISRCEKLFLREGFIGAIQAIFFSIISFGVAPVYALCTNRLDELKENANTISDMGINYSEHLAPLYLLNRGELKEIKKIIESLKEQRTQILNSLQYDSNDERGEVVLYEFESSDGLTGVRIVAKVGAICLTKSVDQNQTSITLMSTGQLLGNCEEHQNLTGLTLNGQDLSSTEFSRAKFNNTTLHNVNLSNTNLRNADFTGATLIDVNLYGAQLDAAILNEAKIKLNLPKKWDKATLQDYFGRQHKAKGVGNLFTAIKSINNDYEVLKINLIHQVIDSLENTNISCIKDDLVFMVMDKIYWQDKKITSFKLTLF